MPRDPVCGMEVDEKDAAASSRAIRDIVVAVRDQQAAK